MSYKVSVIIPFFNSETTIGRCVESLFSQTLSDIEYIFIDDGSKDSSVSILHNVLDKHEERRKDVVLLAEPVNKGQAAARKRGVEMASGDYIIHCDSDDYIEPEMYETMYDMACRDFDIVECGYWIDKLNGERLKWQFDESLYLDRRSLISELLLDKGYSSLCNKLVSRDLYKSVLFPAADIYEDFAITVQLYINAKKIAYVDRLFYHYVKNSGSSLNPVTEEKYRETRISRISNVKFISDIVESKFPKKLYSRQLEKLKFDAKNYWLFNKTYGNKRAWAETFPEIIPSLWQNPYISFRQKLSFMVKNALFRRWPKKLFVWFLACYSFFCVTSCYRANLKDEQTHLISDAEIREELSSFCIPILDIVTEKGDFPTCDYLMAPEGQDGITTINHTRLNARMTITVHGDTLYDSGVYEIGRSGLTLRIRGNTSAYYRPNKPYKLKLQKAADLMRRENNKFEDTDWLLLNDNKLNSILANRVSKIVGISWCPECEYVNLFINGQFQGCYLLSESIKRNPDCRVQVSKEEGFLFENDPYWWNEDVFAETDVLGIRYKYTFKYPNPDNVTPEQVQYVSQVMNIVEQSILAGTYPNYIDVESFAKWLLVHEIVRTKDSGGSNMYLTLFDRSSNVAMSCPWDFGGTLISGKNKGDASGWAKIHTDKVFYYPFLMDNMNDVFYESFVDLWDKKKEEIFAGIDDCLNEYCLAPYNEALTISRKYTVMKWNPENMGKKEYDVEHEVISLKKWFKRRRKWLEKNILHEGDTDRQSKLW